MIGSVTVDAGGVTHRLRLTTTGMMRVEDRFDEDIISFVQAMEARPRIGRLVALLAACMNDGGGAPDDEAAALMDEVGFEKVGDLLGRVVTAAFPEAETDGSGGAATKNPKGADRSA